jgi:hypothetical protein
MLAPITIRTRGAAMRITHVLAALPLCFFTPGCHTTHELPQGPVEGEAIQPQETHRFAVVDATPAKFFDRTVLVEATVQAVCVKKGC